MSGWNRPPGCGRLPGEWDDEEPSRCRSCGRFTAGGAPWCAAHEPFCVTHQTLFTDVCPGCEDEGQAAFHASQTEDEVAV